jgi:hypothetical protein
LPQSSPTFLEEALDAARGTWALVLGRRDAAQYFDFSQRGLVGSVIALVLSLAVQAFGPHPIDVSAPPVMALSVVIMAAVVIAAQYGILYLVLRQLGRADSFLPFLVVQNWATLFQAVIAVAIIGLLGAPMTVNAAGIAELTNGSLPYIGLSIAILVIWVNLARLIMTLRPLHVAIFIATLMGSALVLPLFFGAFMP